MKLLILSLALVLLHPTAGSAQQLQPISAAVPAGVTVTENLVYAEYGDRRLMLDLYRPSDRPNDVLPVVLAIRGGGWQQGDKEGFAPVAAALALRGFAAVSIEYRVSGEAVFPAAIHDVKAAVRWVRANANEYGLDPDAIGALGGSAGAHLAALLGETAGVAELEGEGGHPDESSAIAAFVALAPPVDLVLAAETSPAGRLAVAFMGMEPSDGEEQWSLASPISHVGPDSPPALLIHGGADTVVPPDQTILMASRYAAANRAIEVVMIEDAPHPFWNFETWFEDTMDRSAMFLHRHLDDD